jgi:hypothetical protein
LGKVEAGVRFSRCELHHAILLIILAGCPSGNRPGL